MFRGRKDENWRGKDVSEFGIPPRTGSLVLFRVQRKELGVPSKSLGP